MGYRLVIDMSVPHRQGSRDTEPSHITPDDYFVAFKNAMPFAAIEAAKKSQKGLFCSGSIRELKYKSTSIKDV